MGTDDEEKTANRQQENLLLDAITILASITKKETDYGVEYHNDVDAQNWALREPYELAHDYLNRVMKDDSEPVTLEWLRSIDVISGNRRGIFVCLDAQYFNLPKGITRGDFRTLVRILEGEKN